MVAEGGLGIWQGVSMDSHKFHTGPPSPTLLRPAGGPRLKWPYGRFMGGLPSSTHSDTLRRTPMGWGVAKSGRRWQKGEPANDFSVWSHFFLLEAMCHGQVDHYITN
jgi:hypothetical protein